MKGLVLFLAAVAVSNPVHDVLLMPSGEICVLRTAESGIENISNELAMFSSSGQLSWQVEVASVRRDAAGGVLLLTEEGNILCACEEGGGYTDVFIGIYNSSGEILNSDVISRECYDSPECICAVEEGILLVWDSWSEERGIHLAFLGENAAVRNTEFISGTAHPMNTALDHRSGATILGVSPIAAEEEVLFGLSDQGSVLWSSNCFPEGAMVIHDIEVEESGEFTVLWGDVTVGVDGSSLLLTSHSNCGDVTALETIPFETIAEISAVNILQGGKALIVSNSIRLLETDLDGNILTEVYLEPCHVYSHVIPWETRGYILYGLNGLEAFTGDGHSIFRI